MKPEKIIVFLTTAIFLSGIANSSALAKVQVKKLVCEYKTNPVGIDVQVPRLSWQIVSDEKNVLQSAYEIRVADSPENLFNIGELIWGPGQVKSDQSVNVIYGGPALKPMQRVYWQVRIWDQNEQVTDWSEPAYWETGVLDESGWKASWITSPDDFPEKVSPYFRKEFSVDKKVKSARLYASSLGLYQMQLNGKKVGDQLFTPGWTSYSKRIQYQTYDVTNMLQADNALGAMVGEGWYSGKIGWSGDQGYYGHDKALLAQLVINYADGSSETIVTDNTWKVSSGAILSSSIYDGENYDAQLEQNGWDQVGFDDSKWQKAVLDNHTKTKLIAPQGVPVRAVEEIKPLKLITTPKGETVLDLGQNMVGWVRLKVQGQKGQTVTLKFAELLDKEGNFYTANLRSAKVTDNYILKGKGVETYEPHFTFHGFRYVQLINYPGTPSLDAVTGIVIHSDMQNTGNFSCSEPLINQLQHNIQWGQKGNFLDVPTDCPQRDERLGWTGDAQVFSATAAFNYNVAAFFTKWMKDVAADQLKSGLVPNVIPDVLNGGGGATGWADVALVIPWNMYLAYGDTRMLEVQYPSMKAWVEYMRNRAGDDLLWTEDWHFGDWLAYSTNNSDYPGATTDKGLIATAYFKHSASILAKVAAIIGKSDDASEYAELAEGIKKAFNHEFVTPAGRLVSHTQTAYSLALAFDLLPDELRGKSADYLAGDVKSFGHLTTGFLGTPLLCKTLSATGHEDLAFMLLNRKQYPSWLYPVTQGATTIWERWDGQKPDGTFQDVGMNSFNHYAYGAIGEWMYSHIAGIKIDEKNPGYKHFYLEPHVGGGLTNASASLGSLYGNIASFWRIEDDQMTYKVEIPANTSATVVLPDAGKAEILIDGVKAEESNLIYKGTSVAIELGSGVYNFSYKMD